MAKNKQTSLFVDVTMLLFGASQLVLIAAYMLSGPSSSSLDRNDGLGIYPQDGLALNILTVAISLAYFLFVTMLTALATSNLLKKVSFKD